MRCMRKGGKERGCEYARMRLEKKRDTDCYDCFFSLYLTSPRRSSLLPEGGTRHFCSCISLDSYLHRSVLSHRLRSSFYSSFPLYSFPFYADESLRLGQALLGPCTFSFAYINQRTSCTIPLTLTYSIIPSNIPRSSPLVLDLS